mmetsp:Transcript_5063/g.2843  ORF Transcript_5063/g.2843 Transcript_5063/m.2843 type:complete len:239 (+) Transcript_5063:5208-5924(+)
MNSQKKGVLYIVAVPIGNMEDITLRAINTLKNVDIVAAEDTRNTARLFSYHNIKTPLISYHEHNEDTRSFALVKKLKSGESVALVSDSGTPLISDPGYRIVSKASANGIKITPLPGASAFLACLSASGLPTDFFVFAGFMPKKKQKRLEQIKRLAEYKKTLIFYESPKRIIIFIKELINIMGDRKCVLAREVTKTYEEFIRGNFSNVLDKLANRNSVKGECTLLVSGKSNKEDLKKAV